MPPAISVENVSKKYRLARSGDERLPYRTLRDDLVRWASYPYRALTGRTTRTEDFWALKDVSFEVQPGEVVGVIGRNGAGKSTLLKVLSRITRPTSGHIRLRGRVGSLLEVGTGFHPELTGRENIYLSGAVLGMKRAEIRRKFDEIVAFAEVEKFLDLPVKRYSSGMYMRLAFAVAAHLEPEILLVDEVLAVGDAAFQKKCLGRMGEIAKGGRTVVFVSHNMNAVEQLCNSGLLLDSGTISSRGNDVASLVRVYSTKSDTLRQSEWINDRSSYQNDYISLCYFSIKDPRGETLDRPVSNDQLIECSVIISYNLHLPDPALILGIALYTADHSLLFISYHTDGPDGTWPVLEPGEGRLCAKIPSRLLNEGDYKLELICGLYYRNWIVAPGKGPTVSFSIMGGLSDSPQWQEKRPGAIAPVIEWRTDFN